MKKNLFAWAVACMLAAGEAGAPVPNGLFNQQD